MFDNNGIVDINGFKMSQEIIEDCKNMYDLDIVKMLYSKIKVTKIEFDAYSLHHILTVDYYNKTFVMTRTQIEKD
jgi:hypothetical protein